MFRDLTLALRCEVKELANPRAALFVFTVALLASNVLSVIRAAIRAAHGNDVADTVSTYGLVNDLEGTFRSTELFSQSDEELPGSNRAARNQGNDERTDAPPEHDEQNASREKNEQGNRQKQGFGIDWGAFSTMPIAEFIALLLR